MKRIIACMLITALFACFQPASAQLRKIPAEVTEAFKQKYPDASNVEWKDKLSTFQADFKIGRTDYQARFNSKGEWQETEKLLQDSSIPAPVQEGFNKSKYTEWEVKERAYLQKKDVAYYRILVRKNDLEKKYLFFDETGKLVKEQITL